MTDHDDLPELVRDFKLPTILKHNLTIHTKPPGRRTAPRQAIWRQEKILGHGGYGIVSLQRKCYNSPSAPEFRAVKQILVPNPSSGVGSFVHELEALAKFSQDRYADFFVKSQGWYLASGSLYIAMEYCEYGDLRAYLADKKTLPEDQVQDIATQVLGGLSLMHGVGFAHRDIKPANILIKSQPPDDWWVKVCDLGLSKRTGVAASMTVRGTPGFMPPETIGLDGNPRTANPLLADMWCFGETVYQMLIGSPAFNSYADLVDYHKGNTDFPDATLKKANASDNAIHFIQSLMKPKPSERLTAGQALEQPWMRLAVEQSTALLDLGLLTINHGPEAKPQYLSPTDKLTQPSGAWTVITEKPASSTNPSLPNPVHSNKTAITSIYKPESTKLDNARSENTKPENTEPENTEPENTKPENEMPNNTKLEGTIPESPDPEDPKPLSLIQQADPKGRARPVPYMPQSQSKPRHRPRARTFLLGYTLPTSAFPEQNVRPQNAVFLLRPQPSSPLPILRAQSFTPDFTANGSGTTTQPNSPGFLQQNLRNDLTSSDGSPRDHTTRQLSTELRNTYKSMEDVGRAATLSNRSQRDTQSQREIAHNLNPYRGAAYNSRNVEEEWNIEEKNSQSQRVENRESRHRRAGMDLTYNKPLPKVTTIQGEDGSDGFPKRGSTRIPSKLVSKRALIELRYPFTSEVDAIVVQQALGQRHIDHLLKRSQELRTGNPTGIPIQLSQHQGTTTLMPSRNEANMGLGNRRGRSPSIERRSIVTETLPVDKEARRGRARFPLSPEATARTHSAHLENHYGGRSRSTAPRPANAYIDGRRQPHTNPTRIETARNKGIEQARFDYRRMDHGVFDDPRRMTVRQREEAIESYGHR